MHDLLELYLSALRSGDRPLAAALARALRSSAPLAERADHSLQRMPRGPGRWSAGAERAILRIVGRLS